MTDNKAGRIGKKIRETMNAQKISVKELSQSTGIELQTIYSVLNGHHQISIDKLELISKKLKLSIDALLDIEVNTFPIYAEPYEEAKTYVEFEELWLGPNGGERISVSRNLSIINQPQELRREILEKIYQFPQEKLEATIDNFNKRKIMLKEKEKSRLEIVVYSEIIDFIYQRAPFDLVSRDLIYKCIEGIISKLENEPLSYEIALIPRQHFLVNYEILEREVILFDLGSVFFRQTHPDILKHFLKEVEMLKFRRARISDRNQIIDFFNEHLNKAKQGNSVG